MRQVKGWSEDKNTITIQRLKAPWDNFQAKNQSDNIATAIYLDTETTGIDRKRDKIIDLGFIRFDFDRTTGEIIKIHEAFSQLEDPEEPLSDIVKNLTGYCDDDLKGKAIEWEKVADSFEKAQLIIAHNASFDRAFLDRYLPLSREKVWGCSLKQIDWRTKGHGTKALEYLCKDHGFFFDGHTALADVEAALYLISHKDPDSREFYLKELIEKARIKQKWVLARQSQFEFKDTLRERGYRWDSSMKVWKI